MRKSLSIIFAPLCILVMPITFAAEAVDVVDDTPATFAAAPEQAQTNTGTVSATSSSQSVAVLGGSAGNSLGEYKSVSCSSNPAFAVNSCDQCFDGGSVKIGEKMTGLFDNWINSSPLILVAYKEEQKTPNMVKFGTTTTWSSSPIVESNIWTYSTDIQWITPTGDTKSQFMLRSGQKVKFTEAELGAGYTLEKTDRKAWELVGMLRFPVVYHTLDQNTAAESEARTHYECVTYTLDSPAPVPAAVTSKVTETKTGPETLLLIASAFFIAFGMMFTLRRRS